MTISEVLLLDFDAEVSNTRRTLERVPEDKADWVPHEKSMKLGKLAMHCATILQFGQYIIDDPDMDMAAPRHQHMSLEFKSREECLKALDETSARCRAAIANASDEHMSAHWKFSFGEQVISNDPRYFAYRYMCFNHLIHHTAQLGVYLRLLGVPVPALYGPSADEQWSPK